MLQNLWYVLLRFGIVATWAFVVFEDWKTVTFSWEKGLKAERLGPPQNTHGVQGNSLWWSSCKGVGEATFRAKLCRQLG